MQILIDKIEKRFGEGITYKQFDYQTLTVSNIYVSIHNKELNIYENLSISDLCSPECSFLESLEFEEVENPYMGYTYLGYIFSKKLNSIQYYRTQLSLLSDEEKILYIIKNTK